METATHRMRGSRASRSRLAPKNRNRWEARVATGGIISCDANAPENRASASTGNKVAPVSALLRPARPCSCDGRLVAGTATGDRSRNAALTTAPPAAPSVASGPDHPWLVRVGRKAAAVADETDDTCCTVNSATTQRAPSVFGCELILVVVRFVVWRVFLL